MSLLNVAFAAEEAVSGAASTTSGLINLLPMVGIFIVFYFLLIRPQMKKQKDLQEMINGIKKGDKVVAAGGIIGKVFKIEDNIVSLDIGDDVKIKVLKSSVAEIIDKKSSQDK